MTEILLSKTVRLALFFAGVGIAMIIGDAAYYQVTDDHFSYVIEFFSLMGLMFGAITTKNATDNFLSYRRDTIQYQATGQIPAAPVKQ